MEINQCLHVSWNKSKEQIRVFEGGVGETNKQHTTVSVLSRFDI